MNFSTKTRYGTRALLQIAETAGTDGGITISRIAESQDLSQKYLESLLVKLKRNTVLKSQRGKNGGYSLSRAPEGITVYDIYSALEGPLELVDCSEKGELCPRKEICSTSDLWSYLTCKFIGEMKKISLKDLMDGHIGEINE